MTCVTIYAESAEAGRALETAVRGASPDGVRVRVAIAGASLPVSFDEGDILLVSRGLPRRDVLGILGRSWNSPDPPPLVFLEPHGRHHENDPLELEPACARRVLDAIGRAAEGRAVRSRIGVRFRRRRREPVAVRPLGAEAIDDETRPAIVA